MMSISARLRMALAILLAVCLGCGAAGPGIAAGAETAEEIWIEGESAFTHDFSDIIDGDLYSGGKLLRLETREEAPPDGYTAVYRFDVPETGDYEMRITSTPPEEIWTSPYSVRINDGEDMPIRNARQVGNINDTVRIYEAGVVTLREGENTVTFRVKDRRSYGDYVLYLDSFSFRKLPSGVRAISTPAPFNVFEAGEAATLTVDLVGAVKAADAVHIRVTDFWGGTAYENTVPLETGQTRAEITLGTLEKGHYTVKASLNGAGTTAESFFSVVTPHASRQPLADSPFAIDAAASLLVKPAQTAAFAEALKRSGVTWMRDRFHWGSVHSASGSYDYSAFDPTVRAVADKGIRILNVYADSPDWMHGPEDKLPDDLQAAYRFARDSADHFGDGVAAWEIWNEPDGGFTGANEAGDRYAAFLKAMAIGYRDSAAKPAVSAAGFAGAADDYVKTVADNEVFPYIDTYSFHGYPLPYGTYDTNVIPFPNNAAKHLEFLSGRSASNLNAWMTEAGITIPTGGLHELTQEEQAAQARYMATSAVQSLAAGVDKHFWFVMPNYLENGNQYGMFSQNNAPYASYQAIANVTDMLGKGMYMGQVRQLPSGAEGHLFDSGKGKVLVIWSEEAQTIRLLSEGEQASWTDLMGRERSAAVENGGFTLPIGPDPVFLRIDERMQLPDLSPARPAKPAFAASPLTPEQRVVLAQSYENDARSNAKMFGAYQLKEKEENVVWLDVYNFNDAVMNGEIHGEASGGWQLDHSDQAISLAPGEKKTIEFRLKAGSDMKAMVKSKVTFKGVFGGKATSASVAYVLTGASRVQSIPIPGAESPSSWDLKRNDAIAPSGTGMVEAGRKTGSVRFKYSFGEPNQWAYPFLDLPEGFDISSMSGFAFNIFADEDIAQTDLKLIVNERNGSRYYTLNGFAIKKGWNSFLVPFGLLSLATFGPPDDNDRLDLDRLTSVQIGINTQLTDVPSFEIAGFGTYKVEEEPSNPPETPEVPVTPSGALTETKPKPKLDFTVEAGTLKVKAEPDGEGLASVAIGEEALAAAIGGAVGQTLRIEMKPSEKTRELRLEWPAGPILTAAKGRIDTIAIDIGFAEIVLRTDNVAAAVKGGKTPERLQLKAARLDDLPEPARKRLGDAAACELRLQVDGTDFAFTAGDLQVRLPYSPLPREKEHRIVAYDLSGNNPKAIVNSKYGKEAGGVTFKPARLGRFAAAYSSASFSDLEMAPWARKEIEALAARDVVRGDGSGRFRPDSVVTRAEFVSMLMNALDREQPEARIPVSMSDVQERAWYAGSLAAALEAGIVQGKSERVFGGNEPLSRQDMAVMVDRALQAFKLDRGVSLPVRTEFIDRAEISGYAAEAVQSLQATGILKGTGERFAPKAWSTRAQAAVVLGRLCTRL
ncbi:S-layer homology domain-containing protein [Paenibacillus sp. GCM10027626]|uniref:S-layer homology domain-containing protein n=1 Tax=Paenibacillus sp. GCM10027626 TaxID=3273411 RepID=UPI00362723EC